MDEVKKDKLLCYLHLPLPGLRNPTWGQLSEARTCEKWLARFADLFYEACQPEKGSPAWPDMIEGVCLRSYQKSNILV